MAKYKIIPSSRTIVQSPISIGHKAEKGVEAIEFDVTAWVETYGSGTLTVIMRRWGDAIPYPIALEIDENNKATWTLSDIDTAKAGMAYAQLSYIVGETVVKKSDIYTFRVMDSLTGEGEPPEAYESWLEHLTHFAAEAMAEVLDIEGIVTDKTLTVDGGIADAKATGEALAEKVDAADYRELSDRVGRNTIALAEKADRSTTYTKAEVDQMIEDVEVETDTTLEIDGAPADAAETGRQIGLIKADLDAESDRVDAVVTTGYDYSGNLANTTGVEKSGQFTSPVIFDLTGDGAYYTNPFNYPVNESSSAHYEVKFLDANGNDITLTKVSDSSTSTAINTNTSKAIFEINGTELVYTPYLSNGNHYAYDYILSAIPAKIKYWTRWWDDDKIQLNGFTFGFSSETYLPYVAPSTVYSVNSDFANDIKDYYIASGFIDKTLNTEGATADSKAVGDELYDRKGISFELVTGWIRPTNGVLINDGSDRRSTDYISVTPGETIRVHRPSIMYFTNNAYYNSSKAYVSGLNTPHSVNDITIPEGVYYVRFSDVTSSMADFSVERAGLWTRIADALKSVNETEYRNLLEQSRYGTKVLTLLHFSDLHMDNATMGYITAFRTKYDEFIDDVIQTGDVSNGFTSDWTSLVTLGLGGCLGVIGNHEALGSSKNSATQQELHEKYIAPYVSGWNVVQPTGVDDSASEHYCANYYYKDYTTATIRLIVLDTQKWSSAQLTWFTEVLASARTAGYAVIVASHVLPGAVTVTDCNFSAQYASGGNVMHAFPTDDAPLASEDAVSAVNDFITAGGEFAVWIGGHEHADIFGVFSNYPAVTAYMIDKASIERSTPGATRIRGEKNQHAFNLMTIVRDGKNLKFVRIGEDVDGLMRGKHVFCYNYNTKTVVSQW